MLLCFRPAIAAASGALVLLLAACSGGTPATDDADTDTAVALVETTPAPDETTPPAKDSGNEGIAGDDAPAASIPARWHGDWAADDAGCREPDAHIEGLTISADELRFHESIAVPRSVETLDADSIRVESDYEGQGQQWTATQVLHLSNGDASLRVDGPDGASMTRVRCEPAAQ